MEFERVGDTGRDSVQRNGENIIICACNDQTF